jgi:hypothetical protein
VGDSNELEWLDELVQEHEKGIRDNSNTLKRLILTIEREHKNTPDLTKRLGARPDYGGGWTSAKLDDGVGGA